MTRSRIVLAGALALLAIALAVPAVTLADSGGGSAGDNQYTDPFASGSHKGTSHTTTAAPQTTTQAASTPAPAVTPSTVVSATSAQPTATMASSPNLGTTSSTLPYTGYEAWTAVGFGLAMVAGGIALRLRTRRT